MPTVPNYIKTATEESKDPTLESKVDDEIMWQDKTKDLRPSKRRNKTPVTQDKFWKLLFLTSDYLLFVFL